MPRVSFGSVTLSFRAASPLAQRSELSRKRDTLAAWTLPFVPLGERTPAARQYTAADRGGGEQGHLILA